MVVENMESAMPPALRTRATTPKPEDSGRDNAAPTGRQTADSEVFSSTCPKRSTNPPESCSWFRMSAKTCKNARDSLTGEGVRRLLHRAIRAQWAGYVRQGEGAICHDRRGQQPIGRTYSPEPNSPRFTRLTAGNGRGLNYPQSSSPAEEPIGGVGCPARTGTDHPDHDRKGRKKSSHLSHLSPAVPGLSPLPLPLVSPVCPRQILTV